MFNNTLFLLKFTHVDFKNPTNVNRLNLNMIMKTDITVYVKNVNDIYQFSSLTFNLIKAVNLTAI